MTTFLGQALPQPSTTVVHGSCRLCGYVGPAHWTHTPRAEVVAAVVHHIQDEHPDAAVEPKLLYGDAPGLTEAGRLRINAALAADSGAGERPCDPGCPCGQ